MAGVGPVPESDERILKMREAGIDRNVFIQKVYVPILKYLGVGRHEMLAAQRTALDARAGAGVAEGDALSRPRGCARRRGGPARLRGPPGPRRGAQHGALPPPLNRA